MKIAFVGAHHDDLELSCGGSIAEWSSQGHSIFGITLTRSQWQTPDGTKMGDFSVMCQEADRASKILGYEPVNLSFSDDFELEFKDEYVCELLRVFERNNIDTLITIWPDDAHPTHRVCSEIALAASRKIPRILLVKVSWNPSPAKYNPSFYMDISKSYDKKLMALRCFETEFSRVGESWLVYADAESKLRGLESNLCRAEAFEILRWIPE